MEVLKILLVEHEVGRLAPLKAALGSQGYEVAAAENARLLHDQVMQFEPDVVIVGVDSPDRDTLEGICVMNQDRPRPVVMFSDDGNPHAIRAAIQAGVVSYVVSGLDPGRIRAVLEVAIAQFQAYQALHENLAGVRRELAESKLIDQAKGRLMRELGISEPEAYHRMRRHAMKQQKKIAQVAELIAQAKRLDFLG